jgi:gliding motility-associated lipoprotein GldH
MKIKLFTLIGLVAITASCIKNDVYFQYHAVNETGWNKDSLYKFDVSIDDTSALYNVYVNVRNTKEYPYQNLWLFLQKMNPDSSMVKDSIECYLADQRGKWLGSGMGSILEMPILYQQGVRFEHKGIYQFGIVQGMRDNVLVGISDIGIRVEKADK